MIGAFEARWELYGVGFPDADNVASVTGTTPGGTPAGPVPSNEVVVEGDQNPGLLIVKAAVQDTMGAVGTVIEYTFTVTNTGNVNMSDLVVVDENVGDLACPGSVLGPDESMVCTGTHAVTQSDVDAGQVYNVASVIGTPPGGEPTEPIPSNPVIVPGERNPELSITKSADVVEIGNAVVGDEVNYEMVATNEGNVTLTDVVIIDDNARLLGCSTVSLAPGESVTCRAVHTVTEADLTAGKIVNTAFVAGTPAGGDGLAPIPSNEVVVVLTTESPSTSTPSTSTEAPPTTSPPSSSAPSSTTEVPETSVVEGPTTTDPQVTAISEPESPAQSPPSQFLSRTGAGVAGVLLLGMLLAGFGVAAVVFSRRRSG